MHVSDDRAVYFDGRGIGQLLEHRWEEARGSLSLKLMGLCTLVFLLLGLLEVIGVAERREMWSVFGLSYPGIFQRLWLHQFLTALLIHQTVGQLVFAMLSLWLFGPSLEKALGRGLFVLFVVCCAAMSDLAFLFLTRDSGVLSLGLGGVTTGVFFAQAILFGDHVIPMKIFFRVKMKYAAYLLIGVQLYFALLPEQSGQQLGALTQLCGIAAAFVFVRVWQRSNGDRASRSAIAPLSSRLPEEAGRRTSSQDGIPSEL